MVTRRLSIDIEGDSSSFDGAARAASASADAFDRELRDLERAERRAAQQADRQAAAMRRLETAQQAAANAAERLARGEITAEEAAEAEAEAQRQLTRVLAAQAAASRAAEQAAEELAEEQREAAQAAELAAAQQRLAALRASGATREHNDLLADMRRRFGDLGDDGSGAFEEIESGGMRASRMLTQLLGAGGIGGIAPKLLALPALATAAGGAIALGVGGALAGIGLKVAAQADQVQSRFAQLQHDVLEDLKGMAKPFEQTWMEIADVGERVFEGFKPTLTGIFADLAPVVGSFVRDLGSGLMELRPVLEAFAAAFTEVLQQLGLRAPKIFANVASGLQAIADATARNPDQLARMVEDVSALAGVTGQLVGVLMDVYPAMNAFSGHLSSTTGAIGPLIPALSWLAKTVLTFTNPLSIAGRAWDDLQRAMGRGGEQVPSVEASMRQLGAAVQLQVAHASALSTQHGNLAAKTQLADYAARGLKTSLLELVGGELSAREAAIQFEAAIDAATASIRENGATLNINTEKGRANAAALNNIARTALTAADAMTANGASTAAVSAHMARAREKFIAAAVGLGQTRKAAEAAADKLGLVRTKANQIPPGKSMRITADNSQALSAIAQVINAANTAALAIMNFRHGGLVPAFADGGPVGFPTGGKVRGPGTGTSDSILARVSNGEFVVNAAATEQHYELLHAINSGRVEGMATPAPASAPAMPTPRLAMPARSMAGAGGGPISLAVYVGGARIGEAVIDPLREEIRTRGGDVQIVLGS